MNRTEQLRNQGARDRTGGGGPFVKWPKDRHAWIEGTVTDLWEGEYGLAATIRVSAVDNVGIGGSDGSPARLVEIGDEVNVGLNYASLKNAIQPEDVGSKFHFAFEGWGETKGGDQFRRFAVLELEKASAPQGPSREEPPIAEPEDDLPF